MPEKRDYYDILGLSKGAGDDEIKKAYRNLAKKYHPDVNPGDEAAEAKFKEVNEAYAVLSDGEQRARYDQMGHAAFEGGGPGGGYGFGGYDFGGAHFDISDIFSSFFGGGGGRTANRNAPTRGDDVSAQLTINFEEAVFGCKKEVTYNRVEKCDDCGGSGAAKGTSAETCSTCRGTGQTKATQRTPLGVFQTSRTCDACRGTGKIIRTPCSTCRGNGQVRAKKTLEVAVPAGIDDSQRIMLRGQGNSGRNNGPAGDLVLFIAVRPHAVFQRNGHDVYCDIPITFVEATLGAEIDVPTLEGSVKYNIPEGTQTGTVFTIKGSGVPHVNGKGRGNLQFTVIVEIPKSLSESQKDILRGFADSTGVKNYAKKQSFVKKLFGGK